MRELEQAAHRAQAVAGYLEAQNDLAVYVLRDTAALMGKLKLKKHASRDDFRELVEAAASAVWDITYVLNGKSPPQFDGAALARAREAVGLDDTYDEQCMAQTVQSFQQAFDRLAAIND